jgi:lipid-A-disaccharide synthase
MVIVYRVSPISWAIARRVVSIDTIGLVNIVAGRKIVPEHLQGDIDAAEISEELRELIFDQGKRARLSVELERVKESLGEPGASGRAAAIALNLLKI